MSLPSQTHARPSGGAWLKWSLLAVAAVFLASWLAIWIEPAIAKQAAQKSTPPPPQQSTPPPAGVDHEAKLQQLRAEVEAEKQRLQFDRERLQALDGISRLLLFGTGLFAALLGLSAWRTLDDQRKSAQEALALQIKQFSSQFEQAMQQHQHTLARSQKDIEDLRKDLEKDFPLFGRIRRNFKRILGALTSACEGLKSDDETFRRLAPERKEEILFFERAVADTLLIEAQDYGSELTDIYRLLGIFYGSRYASELGDGTTAVPRDHLDRSIFYFDKALDFDRNNAIVLSHAAYFCLYYDDPALARRAHQLLLEATALRPQAQRLLINLALLALEAHHDADEALRYLAEAEKATEWEAAGSPPRPNQLRYVKACALTRKADKDGDATLYAAALAELEAAAVEVDDWMRACLFSGDYQSKADTSSTFLGLSQRPELHDRWEAFLDKTRPKP